MSKSNNTKDKQEYYWYSEDDISGLLKHFALSNSSVNVFAQTQFEHKDLLTDNFKNATKNAHETGRTQLMPINLHGNHWAGAIVRKKANGQIQIIYNDPLGETLKSQPNAKELVAVVGGTEIIDLRLKQQNNGNDCGPFTADNLVQLASANGLDCLDRQGILGLGILATPANGSASEIRDKQAVILSKLEVGYVKNKAIEKLQEKMNRNSDDAFLGDIEKLLNLKLKISELKTISAAKEKQIKVLEEIAQIASSVYRKDTDKSAIRNKFSSNEESKKNVLYLDILELFVHLPNDKHRINDNWFEKANFLVIANDLAIISENIDFVLSEKEIVERVKNLSLKDKSQEKKINPQYLKAFIASFYVPKALERMREVIPKSCSQNAVPKYEWKDRIDRYDFARTFAILGELSRDIRCVITEKSDQRDFFQTLKNIRNNLKGLAHKKFFSNGIEVALLQKNGGEKNLFVEDIEKLNKVVAYFKELDENLSDLQGYFAEDKVDGLESVKCASSKKILNEYGILKEFEKMLEGKNDHEGELRKLINDIIQKRVKVANQEEKSRSSSVLSVMNEYKNALNNIDDTTKLSLGLPTTDGEIIKFGKESIKKIPLDDEKLKNYLRCLKNAKEAFAAGDRLKSAKKELVSSNQKYKESYEKIEDEYLYDFPDPSDDDKFEKFLNEKKEEEKIQNYSSTKTRENISRGKYGRRKFSKYCADFEEESKRLREIISFQPITEEKKRRHEFAVAHSVGIIGEKIRYLFEIDDETNFLGEFARRALLEDINETRMVRNKQVMHETFNYDSDAVFRVATQNTTPWEYDIRAIGLVHEFITSMSHDKYYLDRKAAKVGLTSDRMQMRMAMFVGASYVRLGKINDANKILENARSIALSKEDKPEVEEIIRINNLLSAIARKNGINTLSLDLINESLQYVEKYPQYKSEESHLLTNKATILSEGGNNKEAKELYKKAMSEGFVPAAISLGQLLCEEKKYDDAILIYRKQFLEIYPKRDQRPFEFVMTLRGLYLAQSESGQHKEADRTFNNYTKFYRSNIPLFKAQCGQGFKNVEAMILHDEGSNLYCNGHYNRAINRLENALSLLDETGIRSSRDVSHIHLNIANCYKYLASKFSSDSNISEYRQLAIQHFEETIQTSDHMKSIDVAHANAGLAEIRSHQRLTKKSTKNKEKANSIYKQHEEMGSGYAEIMSASLKVINSRSNTEIQHEDESYGDDHAFLQSLLPKVNDCIRCSDYRGALNTINFCLSYMEALNTINPVVALLRFQKFVCHCHLNQKQKAINSYESYKGFVENHPDCADHSHRNATEKIFLRHFSNSASLLEKLTRQIPDS